MVKKYDSHVTIYVFMGNFNNFVINLWLKAFVSPYSEIAIVLASSKQFEEHILVHILIIAVYLNQIHPQIAIVFIIDREIIKIH
ncbi:hypothetical protein [Microcoleus sp.]|uniref:hypothetical protein n=1 Tax=Microcoleus sp. TaxID=44472 RepID=UPI00403E3DFC